MFTARVDPEKYLYHYTGLKTALEYILPSLKLKVGTPANVNDPRESKTWYFALICPTDTPGNRALPLLEEVSLIAKGTCKALCLTRDNPIITRDQPDAVFGRGYAHSRMWAQYAEKHTGVCLIVDRQKLSNRIAKELGHKGTIYHGSVDYRDEESTEDFQLSKSIMTRSGKSGCDLLSNLM